MWCIVAAWVTAYPLTPSIMVGKTSNLIFEIAQRHLDKPRVKMKMHQYEQVYSPHQPPNE